MTKNVNFREVSNTFQNQLRSDIKNMKKEPKIFMKADKTTNYYKVEIDKSEEMIEKEVHKDYKKATPKLVEEIRAEAVSLATELGVEDRIFTTSENETYNTIKDHKEDFRNNPKCRQVNPCKPDLGKVSKCRLEEIAEIDAEKSGLTQFKNTQGFLSWYNNLADKSKGSFYQLDITKFYPSITEKLLLKAIEHAAKYTHISDKALILHTCKSLLYHKGEAWVRKGRSTFEITVGGWDGAEKCDLVGLYLLSELAEIDEIDAVLYRDDGAAFTLLSPKEAERTKNKIVQVFKDEGLDITIDANLKVMNFLDVEVDLNTGTHKPFTKPNNTLLYIDVNSNHPQTGPVC